MKTLAILLSVLLLAGCTANVPSNPVTPSLPEKTSTTIEQTGTILKNDVPKTFPSWGVPEGRGGASVSPKTPPKKPQPKVETPAENAETEQIMNDLDSIFRDIEGGK